MYKFEFIRLLYSCSSFDCRYGPEAFSVCIAININNVKSWDIKQPVCEKCGCDMTTDFDKELEDVLCEAGIKINQ